MEKSAANEYNINFAEDTGTWNVSEMEHALC